MLNKKKRQREAKACLLGFVSGRTVIYNIYIYKDRDILFEHHFDPFISLLFTAPDFSYFFPSKVNKDVQILASFNLLFPWEHFTSLLYTCIQFKSIELLCRFACTLVVYCLLTCLLDTIKINLNITQDEKWMKNA